MLFSKKIVSILVILIAIGVILFFFLKYRDIPNDTENPCSGVDCPNSCEANIFLSDGFCRVVQEPGIQIGGRFIGGGKVARCQYKDRQDCSSLSQCGEDGLFWEYGCTSEGCEVKSKTCTQRCCQDILGPESYCKDNKCIFPSKVSIKLKEVFWDESVSFLCPFFSWEVSGLKEPQIFFEIEVDDSSNFSSPEIKNKFYNSSTSFFSPSCNLKWNRDYFWRVRVGTQDGKVSDWSKEGRFKTHLHPLPKVNFTFSPALPTTNDEIQFKAEVGVFNSTVKSYFWDFGDGSHSTKENPVYQYKNKGRFEVKLEIEDSDGYKSSAKKEISILMPLPKW